MTQTQYAEAELPGIADATLAEHRVVMRDMGRVRCGCGEWLKAADHPLHRRLVLSQRGVLAMPSSILIEAVDAMRKFASERLSDTPDDEMDPGVRLHDTLHYLDVVSARFFLNRPSASQEWVRADTSDSAIVELVSAATSGHAVEEMFAWCGTYDITCSCGAVMPEDFHAAHRLWELLEYGLIVSDSQQLVDIAERMLATAWEWRDYYLDGLSDHDRYRARISSAMSVVGAMMDYLTR